MEISEDKAHLDQKLLGDPNDCIMQRHCLYSQNGDGWI